MKTYPVGVTQALVVADREAGLSLSQIAAKHECSIDNVTRHLRRYRENGLTQTQPMGVREPAPMDLSNASTEEKLEHIATATAHKYSVAGIANACNISEGTVSRYRKLIKQNGAQLKLF